MKRLTFALLFLTACDSKVVVSYGTPERSQESVSCTYTGMCYGCGINSSGDYKCGFGFRHDCSGHQQATIEKTPYTWHWESKPEQIQTSYERRVVDRQGTCR